MFPPPPCLCKRHPSWHPPGSASWQSRRHSNLEKLSMKNQEKPGKTSILDMTWFMIHDDPMKIHEDQVPDLRSRSRSSRRYWHVRGRLGPWKMSRSLCSAAHPALFPGVSRTQARSRGRAFNADSNVKATWLPKTWWNMGMSPQWNSHLIGIMISKTNGFRGTLFSDKPTSWNYGDIQ